jgi:hypothetical protein
MGISSWNTTAMLFQTARFKFQISSVVVLAIMALVERAI